LLVAGAIPLLFAGRSHASVYAFALVFGIGLGGDYTIVPLMAAEIFAGFALLIAMGLLGVLAAALLPKGQKPA